ncbi:phage baseplate assembly protein V [Veillonella seminalis]|uniref:Phage baseplate assembly protein V n=1 Tax=Veillonella seminalis ACS-216-V-Col6b TaxID=883156 RepID=K9DLV7_9FIRM|nr:phage baseplate assembly protein V [Veillonella seminalis]EKU78345.1 phage baseplate assembly protein V [Veillonella seminalis ACS-216-V-Col6b]
MATINQIVVKGYIDAIDPTTHTARAVIPDKDNKVTGPLQILEKNTLNNKHQHSYAIGEQVLIIFDPNSKNLNEGWIIGAMYSGADTPPVADENVETAVFSDGTSVSMNTSSGTLSINSPGTVNIKAGTINIEGAGDVVVNGISLVNHTHGGVVPGGGSTGKPQ